MAVPKTTKLKAEKKATRAKGYRAWCFIINNWTEAVYKRLQDYDGYTYIAVGKEVAPTTGTPHLQCYVEFASTKTISAFNKNIGCKANDPNNCWASMKPRSKNSTPQDSAGYCMKGSEPSEYLEPQFRKPGYIGNKVFFDKPSDTWEGFQSGEISNQGRNPELEEMRDQVLAGELRADDVLRDHPTFYHMYGRTIHGLENLHMRERYRTEMTKCIWYWGKSNTGKSHMAHEGFTPQSHYIWKKSSRSCAGYQCGYRQQDTVIINELNKEYQLKWDRFKELIDKWPCFVERKGNEDMPFTSKLVIITSACPPEQVYKDVCEANNEDWNQFQRRVKVLHRDEVYVGHSKEMST